MPTATAGSHSVSGPRTRLLKVGGDVENHVTRNGVIAQSDRDFAGVAAGAKAEGEGVRPAATCERRPKVDARGSWIGRPAWEKAEVTSPGEVDDRHVAHDPDGVGGQAVSIGKRTEDVRDAGLQRLIGTQPGARGAEAAPRVQDAGRRERPGTGDVVNADRGVARAASAAPGR